MIKSLYSDRPLVLFGVLSFWALTFIDAYPHHTLVQERVDDFVDPFLNRTSLWQGDWKLFAPEPDHWNNKLECVVIWEDGSQSTWSTPKWTEISIYERMRNFRRNELYESMMTSETRALWPSISKQLVEEMTAQEQKRPHLAELYYFNETLPHPEEAWRQAFTDPEFGQGRQFFMWYPHELSESEVMFYGN